MTQGIDNIWQAEARAQQTKQLIRDIKRITRRTDSLLPGMPLHTIAD